MHVYVDLLFSRSLSNAIKDSESIQANCLSLIEGDPLEALTQEEDILNEVQYNGSHQRLSFIQPTETIPMRAQALLYINHINCSYKT